MFPSSSNNGPSVDRQHEIYHAAVSLFREQGFHATSMRDIADAIGIRTSSIYYHYPAKEAILYDIMRRFLTDLLRGMGEVAEKDVDLVELLHAAIEFHVRYHGERALEAMVTDTEVRALKDPYRSEVIAWRDQYERILQDIIERGVATGQMRGLDTKISSYAVLGLATSIVSWYRPGGRCSLEEIAREYADLGVRGVLPL